MLREGLEVTADGLEIVAVVGSIGLAMASLVQSVDRESRRQLWSSQVPNTTVGCQAVEQHERRAVATPVTVVEVHSA